MKKSISKRIKITRSGKIMRRWMALDHFRTRKSRKLLRKKNKLTSLNLHRKHILNY